ncbi:hypothetical protein OT109_09325 [Phycisphaeraceae bacterium D3-23]
MERIDKALNLSIRDGSVEVLSHPTSGLDPLRRGFVKRIEGDLEVRADEQPVHQFVEVFAFPDEDVATIRLALVASHNADDPQIWSGIEDLRVGQLGFDLLGVVAKWSRMA